MNDLDQLKELLFGAERKALDSISERVESRDVRTTDIADVLPEAIHKSHTKDGELVEALAAPVGECLQQEFRDDPETYADALYPVIGPAIRKSIMHALRNFSQQINEAIEHSISPKGLKWRWQASRAGVPYGEYVLQQTMLYRVEQAYLISRENGLLVAHVHHEASKIKDSDAVSAMFTAIQDFVKESFSPDRTGRLESADMGEFTLWAVHGPHALLVCVIRGVPPKSLRTDLTAILERIHFRYGEAIRDYKGETATIPDAEVELERCLKFEARAVDRKEKKGRPIVGILVGVLLVAALVALGIRSWNFAQQLKQLESAVAAAPGIHVTELTRNGGDFSLKGLRDPLADDVQSIAAQMDIPADRLSVSMQSFQSLEPEIIERRAAQLLGSPDSVTYKVSGSTLHVSGNAAWSWRSQLQSRFSALAGVDALDSSGLVTNDRALFEKRVEDLNEKIFLFNSGTEFAANAAAELRQHAVELRELSEESSAMGYSLDVIVVGSTDASGNPQANAVLAARRANVAAEFLYEEGVDARIVPAGPTDNQGASGDLSMRHVKIRLQLRQAPAAR